MGVQSAAALRARPRRLGNGAIRCLKVGHLEVTAGATFASVKAVSAQRSVLRARKDENMHIPEAPHGEDITDGVRPLEAVKDIDIIPDPLLFGEKMRLLLEQYGENHAEVLRCSADIARNLERLKMVSAFVRRQAMLDAQNELGNGAAVGRLAGVGRVRSHQLINRATDERMHRVTLEDVVGYAEENLYV